MNAYEQLPQPPSPRRSLVSIRRPSVLLVGIEPGEEQAKPDLESLAIRSFRVRYALQACVRMHVLRPEVILVGTSVQPWAMARVLYAAQEIKAAVMPRSHHLVGDRLLQWVLSTIDIVRQRRREDLEERAG